MRVGPGHADPGVKTVCSVRGTPRSRRPAGARTPALPKLPLPERLRLARRYSADPGFRCGSSDGAPPGGFASGVNESAHSVGGARSKPTNLPKQRDKQSEQKDDPPRSLREQVSNERPVFAKELQGPGAPDGEDRRPAYGRTGEAEDGGEGGGEHVDGQLRDASAQRFPKEQSEKWMPFGETLLTS